MLRSRRNVPNRRPAFFAGTAALLLAGCIAASDAVKAQPAMAAATDTTPALTVAAFAPSPKTYARLKTPAGRTEFVQTYCVGCHNARAKTAGLVLEGIVTDQLPEHAVIWEKVIKRLGAGCRRAMRPDGRTWRFQKQLSPS